MDFITVRRLQGEFGLSFVTAESIIRKHRRQAWRRYWPLSLLSWVLLGAWVGPGIVGLRLPHAAVLLLGVAVLALVSLQWYLAYRVSREPILAAARAQQANAPTADSATPGNV